MKNCRWVGWLTGGVNGDPMDGMYLSAWEIAREPVGQCPDSDGSFIPSFRNCNAVVKRPSFSRVLLEFEAARRRPRR